MDICAPVSRFHLCQCDHAQTILCGVQISYWQPCCHVCNSCL